MNVRSALLLTFLAAAVTNGACRSHSAKSDAPPAPVASDSPIWARTAPNAASALPEDPEAGARSVAEWRQHLEQEEHERRLGYDRRRLPQHRALLKTLRAIRQSYDDATSERAVLSAQQKEKALLPKLEKSLVAIDHWQVNSKVLPEYRKLIELFSDSYPSARLAALSGEKDRLATVRSDVAARFETIDEWLREAAESEDE